MKRNYTPVVSAPVDMNKLRRFLLVASMLPTPPPHKSVKLPLDMEVTYNDVPVYPYWGENKPMGHFTVVVKKHVPHTDINRYTNKPTKSSKHRIFIKIGDRLIPAGRAAQAKITIEDKPAISMLRIQKGEGVGAGVYRDYIGYRIMEDFHGFIGAQWDTDKSTDHPGPHRDSKMKDAWNNLSGRTNYLFGFRDENQLRAWIYEDGVLQLLFNAGFEIIEYQIGNQQRSVVGHTQMVAHRDDMIRVGVYQLKF